MPLGFVLTFGSVMFSFLFPAFHLTCRWATASILHKYLQYLCVSVTGRGAPAGKSLARKRGVVVSRDGRTLYVISI